MDTVHDIYLYTNKFTHKYDNHTDMNLYKTLLPCCIAPYPTYPPTTTTTTTTFVTTDVPTTDPTPAPTDMPC